MGKNGSRGAHRRARTVRRAARTGRVDESGARGCLRGWGGVGSTSRARQRLRLGPALIVGMLVALTGCTSGSGASSSGVSSGAVQPSPTTAAADTPSPVATPIQPVQPVGEPVAIASDLDVPWSILRLPPGGTFVSLRDEANIVELLPDGTQRVVSNVSAATPAGEGGLLGLAFLPDAAAAGGLGWVYAYFTADTDNRIERMALLGTQGNYTLGAPESVLTGIPKVGNHDGGRIAFGPDGLLYATAGDAGNTDNAQNRDALGGKILRMTPTGDVPAGNPFGTLVYSYGHRNPQGIAWDSRGQLWASEFGQNTWDELNLITAGGNYGWPIVEGMGTDSAFINPVHVWPTSEASPSGIAIVADTIFMASLRGERLWRIVSSTGTVDDWFVHSFGRLRDVVSGPDGTLWFVSNNTDGRGDPSTGDDRLYQVQVAP